jgi:sirohydrochlorin ferrochelatase
MNRETKSKEPASKEPASKEPASKEPAPGPAAETWPEYLRRVSAGATQIRVFPLFLGVGKHAREDLPLIIEEIRSKHPQVRLDLLATAGESARLTALLADIALA